MIEDDQGREEDLELEGTPIMSYNLHIQIYTTPRWVT